MSGINFDKKVLMLAPSSWPTLGGVQTHLGNLSRELVLAGWEVKILTPPQIRPAGKIGLLWLWGWVIYHSSSFLTVQVIHIHDVFLWFWPIWPIVKFFNLFKSAKTKIITTFHGWEGKYPPTEWQKLNKFLAQLGSDFTVAVGDFISKFYPIEPSLVVYGGVESIQLPKSQKSSQSASWIYLGRLSQDTGLAILLNVLEESNQKLEFWGDGPLSSECQKHGHVVGWISNPLKRLSQLNPKPKGVIAGGYLAVLEALSLGLRVIVLADNKLKSAYYGLAPFAKYLTIVPNQTELKLEMEKPSSSSNLTAQIKDIQTNYSWKKLAQEHIKLYEFKN